MQHLCNFSIHMVARLLFLVVGRSLAIGSCLVLNIIWLVCMMLSKTCIAIEEADSCAIY